jgi:hypothetical protein
MDFQKLCKHHNQPTAPPGDKHNREGWVNVPCPFCSGNSGYHLGYNENSRSFNCHRCGRKGPLEVIRKLLGVNEHEAKRILRKFKGRPRARELSAPKIRNNRKLIWPTGVGPMEEIHRRYLRGRGFVPEDLERRWGLLGSGRAGPYKFRVMAPIHFEEQLVSYQGRDITGRSDLKYKACKQEEEVRDHKHCLYGMDFVPGNSIVIVEGIVDVWRLGPGAVATFGISYTRQQVNLLRGFRNRFVMFDSGDPQAVAQARLLAAELSGFAGNTEILTLDGGDPGEMPQKDADSIMREVLS